MRLGSRLILHRKRYSEDDAMQEVKLWELPQPVRGSLHAFKYSLFYGRKCIRLVGYDNEAGKGDHRHYEGCEFPYQFQNVRQLVRDFLMDVEALRRERLY